jgi:class 3 adenylate cyclase/tetratricopeptide (TPR) repeat protein
MNGMSDLVHICPNCGEENPSRFRMCGFCGTSLGASAVPQDLRKTVTIVFSDLKGSTSLGESLDPESLREVMSRYFDEMRAVLERHGGTVEKFIGDAVMAVFGIPRLHEDDALRAVRAASEMQAALRRLNSELRERWGVELSNRTGVNTGEVVAGDPAAGQRLVTGDAVNVAARLEQAAGPNEILIGEPTQRLVREAVDVEAVEALPLKGKAEPVAAFRLLGVRRNPWLGRRFDAPLVGRDGELTTLLEALATTRRTDRPRLVTVVGEAGVGKSRLILELIDRAGPAVRTLSGRCLSYGEGITYWALGEIVRQAAQIDEADTSEVAAGRVSALLAGDPEAAQRIEAAIGLSAASFEAADTAWAARRLFESIAAAGPLIVHFEDIHWAEPTLLDLIETVCRTAEGAPILFLCSTRHDLFDARPEWDANVEDALRVELEPLTPADSDQIVENLLGGDAVPPALRRRIRDAAGGHPLYIEQYFSMLVDDGHLQRTDAGWKLAVDAGSLGVPASVAALLTARIDRLDPDERAVVERGSVIGLAFYRSAVEELSSEAERPTVGPLLLRVTARHLIRPVDEFFANEETFEFRHVLIREAAYGTILKRGRAELHERFADWLERVMAVRQLELEEILGYHLEQAHRYRAELGPLDLHARAVGARAAQRLASAGRRAFARGDMPASANLLNRAIALLPEADGERVELLCDLAEALLDLGELEAAEEASRQAIAGGTLLGDERLIAAGGLARQLVRFVTDSEDWTDAVNAEVERSIPVLERIGDHGNLARAWRLLGSVHGRMCRYAEAERAAERAIDHARLAGDARQETRNLPAYAMSALYGPMPVENAIARCEQLLEQAPGDLRAEGIVRCTLAHLQAMVGRFDEARRQYRLGRERFVRLGGQLLIASTSLDSGRVELLAGDPDAALGELQPDHDALEAMGERYLRSTLAGLIARAHLDAGRPEEAGRYAASCRALAAPDDTEAQALWRGVQARLLAAGDAETATADSEPAAVVAERLAREAVEATRVTDSPGIQAAALADLAWVLLSIGRDADADATWTDARALLEAKGNVVAAVALDPRASGALVIGSATTQG